MFGELNHLLVLVLREQALEPLLALHERERAEILVTKEQQIEREEEEAGSLACLHRGLKRREIGNSVLPNGAYFAINIQLSNPRATRASSGKVEL